MNAASTVPRYRIDDLRTLAAGRKALIPYVTAGDPSLDATVPVMHALVEAGADVIELGVPFSDPMADGPVIQRSSERALAHGVGLAHVLDCVRAFRARDADTPVVLMGYANPVEIRGSERFAARGRSGRRRRRAGGRLAAGGSPTTCAPRSRAHGLALILLAPTTTDARMARLCARRAGLPLLRRFAGVTGADHLDAGAAGARLRAIRAPGAGAGGRRLRHPRRRHRAAAMAADADAVVIGSALIAAPGRSRGRRRCRRARGRVPRAAPRGAGRGACHAGMALR